MKGRMNEREFLARAAIDRKKKRMRGGKRAEESVCTF